MAVSANSRNLQLKTFQRVGVLRRTRFQPTNRKQRNGHQPPRHDCNKNNKGTWQQRKEKPQPSCLKPATNDIIQRKDMKRLLLLLILTLATAGSMKAMSYEQARREAWFLTDKMAYELNLTPTQFDCAYRVNLDYLMSINTASDCYGYYWSYRDDDLRCILFDWQYALYSSLDYFYRPVRWLRYAWYFPVCDHYRRGYYYFERPAIYISYRGGMWTRRGHNDISPYRRYSFRPGRGMRDNIPGARPIRRPEPGRPNRGYRPEKPNDNYRPGYAPRPERPGRGETGRPAGGYTPGQGNHNDRPSRNDGSYSNPGGSNYRPSRDRSNSRPSRGSENGNVSGTGRQFGR